jgi:HD superfamily phosphohydrolase
MLNVEGFEINDGIDSVEFPHYVELLMKPAEFQRLNRVRQLGMVDYVFPNATHTRKAHSIGAAKNGMNMWRHAAKNGLVRLDIKSYEPTIISALLYHDTGHGPFSHSLQNILEGIGGLSHETVSAQLVTGEYSLQQFYQDLVPGIFSDNDRKLICDILRDQPLIPDVLNEIGVDPELVAQIIDKDRKERNPDKVKKNLFLVDIVSGIIDADRLDYLERDARVAGVKVDFDKEYMIRRLGIVYGKSNLRLGIEEKGMSKMVDFLNLRANMHNRVYTHKVVLTFEAMAQEALKRVMYSLDNPERYVKSLMLLTDEQLHTFVSAHSKNPVATKMYFRTLYDRSCKYDIAWGVKSKHVPTSIKNDHTDLFQKLDGSDLSTVMRDEILKRVNAGKTEKIEEHEVIVYSRLARTGLDEAILREKFEFLLFNKKNSTQYFAHEKFDDASLFDGEIVRAFAAFKRPINSYYILVLTPPKYKSRVKRATEHYVKELTK